MLFSTGLIAVAAGGVQQAPSAVPVPMPKVGDPQTAEPPIVPDDTFNKALPPLSNDINAPLEPLSPIAMPTPAAPAEAVPPELTQPLPALQAFDSTPLVDVTVKDAKSPDIRYDTVIRGLDTLGLTGKFNGLSALRGGDGKAANATVVSARGHEDEDLAIRLMKSLGYYDGTAISTIEQIPGDTARVRAIVSATPGKQYKLGTIMVQAAPTLPAGLVQSLLPLRTGEAIEAERVQGAEANVALVLPQRGYPFAKVGQRDILLDDVAGTGDYTLPVDVGPRSSFGTFTTEGRLAFGAAHVGVLTRFKPGDLYDNRKVDDLRAALVATGLFSTVSVEPVRTGNIGPDGTEQVNLLVEQERGPARSVAVSGGYSTGQGIRLEGSFTHRNLFPPEGALIVTAVAGTQEQGATATFRRSNAGRRDRTVTFTAGADHSNYDAFDAFTTTFSGRISYDSTPIWQKKFTYAYGFELTGTNESVYDFGRGARRRATYFIAALPGQVEFDRSDSLLNPTKGYRLKLSLSPETSVRGAVRPYARTLVEASGYYPIGDSIVLAGRVRAGSIAGTDRDDLAPSRRYYGGGGGSVRGYGYQRLGPLDPNGDPVGGRSINEFALEARYRFGNFGIVPFLDGGNAYESVLPKATDLRFGAGIGGRFYTNFGPLRFDVATPLNPRKGDGKIALYISIGQAF
ncbi:autotransporter assembly complex protein TamA [Sphingomonas echinoides]|uniref:BamA/TamA family outer membrane protein n=3 Tax=Pseudomonadota TaxID=1224 RepID=A0ABU4PKY5_9SPHN|nr:BamA/TamA family outer membrane protein [Sphingomonas echinoides]MDX5984634.1 BamA/TamA family outer membrane protein [Sphingomonas echinoides]